MKKILALLAGLTLAIITSSCESSGGGSGGGGGGSGPDDLDISSATTLDHNQIPAQNAAITRQLYSANKNGGYVEISYEKLNWPRQGKVEGGAYIYWKDGSGSVIGGLFEFHGSDRSTVDLKNIMGHKGTYLGGKQPPAGAQVYFCLVNLKGTERTNVVKSPTNW